MNTLLLLSSLLFSGNFTAAFLETAPHSPAVKAGEEKRLASVMRCRTETSPLVRLDCYDTALSLVTGEQISQTSTGPAWQRAMAQEKERKDHSTAFLVTESEGENPVVVITTPAIGVPPPRPVLMLSCIDNITRLQIALSSPQKDGSVTLIADTDRFYVQWFLRENGYLLESSRGLAGIDEIKRLMSTETLTIDSKTAGFPRLTFNISQLTQMLKPLRNACHW